MSRLTQTAIGVFLKRIILVLVKNSHELLCMSEVRQLAAIWGGRKWLIMPKKLLM